MKTYLNIFSRAVTAATPQARAIPNTVPDATGGYASAIDDWARLNRFLILGSEGCSSYAGERVLTRENAAAVLRTILADGARVVARIVEISAGGRAPKNEACAGQMLGKAEPRAGCAPGSRRVTAKRRPSLEPEFPCF